MPQIPICSTLAAADTNATALSVCRVCEPVPGTPWTYVEPNEIGSYSPELGRVVRNPISLDRQNRKGAIVSLTASPAFTEDATMDSLRQFTDAFLFSAYKGENPFGLLPTAATVSGYTIPTGAARASGSLVYAAGWANPANNGLKVVGAGSTTTNVAVTGLVAEAAPAGAVLHAVGVQGASGDIQVNAGGNLTSTTLNFTTLGLTVGQFIFVGGTTTATKFATAENYGLARVRAISANLLTLDNTGQTFTVDNGSGKTIQLFFGSFVRNVPVDSPDYLSVRHTIEARYNTTPATYEYAREAYCNQLTLSMPVEDKVTVEYSMVAKDMEATTETRKDGTWSNRKQTEAINTSTDFMRLRVNGADGLGLDTFFKDATLTVNNGAAPEPVLGNPGAAFVNFDNLAVSLESELVMVNGDVLAAIRNNDTVSMTVGLRNSDGAAVYDIPACTLGDGAKSLTRNEKVRISTTVDAFKHPSLGYTLGVSLFGYCPQI